MLNENYNFGLILKDDPRDLILGADTDESGFIIIRVSDWLKYKSANEKQHSVYFDTRGCVTFAILKQVAWVFNYLVREKKISQLNIDWLKLKGYLDENNQFNVSERFCLVQNGTYERNGNDATTVYQSAFDQKTGTGLIPQKMLDYPTDQRKPVFDTPDFYDKSVITDEMRKLGKEFLERFDIRYFRVNQIKPNRDYYLPSCPLVCFVRCSCTEKLNCSGEPGHAVVYYTPDLLNSWLPLHDTYESRDKDFIRLMGPDYQFPYNMRAIRIKEKKIMEFIQKKGSNSVYKIGTKIVNGKREILPIISGETFKRVFNENFDNIEVVDSLEGYEIGPGIGLIAGLD